MTIQPHQSSKHLPIDKVLFISQKSNGTRSDQIRSDPGSTQSYIDHVSEEAEPGNGTDLISVVEK